MNKDNLIEPIITD